MTARSEIPNKGSNVARFGHIYAGVAAFAVFAIGVAIWALLYLRHEAEGRMATNTRNLAISLEQTIEGKIDTIDMALQSAVDEIGRQVANGKPDRQSITAFLIRQQKRVAHLDLLRATDEHGVALYGDGVPEKPTSASSIADREYFPLLRDNPNVGLIIAKPIVGKLSQKWIWLFARRINKADGTFGGVVYGSIYIDALTNMFARMNLQPNSVISLRDHEFGSIARHTFGSVNSLPIGDRQMSKGFQEAVGRNQREGSYLSDQSAADGVARMTSYKRNDKYGFNIIVGVPTEALAAEWKYQAAFVVGVLAVFLLSLLAYARKETSVWLNQEQSREALARLNEELAQKERQSRRLAFYDSLTSLPNRRLLSDRLSQTMAASKRSGHFCALLFLDLDNFKPLNDEYGHRVGDLLLMEVADRIRACVREIDTVARLGGDEFVVVISGISANRSESAEQARLVAEKVRSALAGPYVLSIKQGVSGEKVVEHHCTVSIGVALFLNHEISESDLIACADKAMYQAKLAGRNTICFWE